LEMSKTVWILVDEHGDVRLYRSLHGTLKLRVRCSKCGRPAEGIGRGHAWRRAFYEILAKGRTSAVCDRCVPESGWRAVE